MVQSTRVPGLLATVLLLATLVGCGQTATVEAPTSAATTEAPAATAAPAGDATAAPAGDAATGDDLLAQVRQRGRLLISTDPNYKPQSFRNPDGSWEGFDIDVAREIATRLGVEAEFLDISFDIITAGGWNGRWDVNVGSMTVTPERKQVLLFTSPYYYTPAAFVVHADSTAASIDDLNGKRVGVGAATTYLSYMQNNLTLEGETPVRPAPQAEAQVYDTDALALADLALGDGTRLDAVLTALPTAQDAINGGQPFKILGEPVYYEQLAVALDQGSAADSASLQAEISTIIDAMRADGTLTRLSNQYYGVDLTTKQ
jgi:polar amino acid transport system substrate-binding protein